MKYFILYIIVNPLEYSQNKIILIKSIDSLLKGKTSLFRRHLFEVLDHHSVWTHLIAYISITAGGLEE